MEFMDRHYTHLGTSMIPTLSDGDLLEARPLRMGGPVPGDVIIYPSSTEDIMVVHRIVRECGGGFISRGDNCPCDDPWFVQTGQIIGVVRYRWRNGQRREIVGGWRGLMLARMRWMLRPARLRLYRLLGPVYRLLSEQGIARKILPERLRPRVVSFSSDGGEFRKILLGSRVIGNFDVQRAQWQIRRPFKLFIPEEILNRPSSSHLQAIGKDQAC